MGSEIADSLPSMTSFSYALFELILAISPPIGEKERFLHFCIQLQAGWQGRKGHIFIVLLPW
jgi:hypothetical protein